VALVNTTTDTLKNLG